MSVPINLIELTDYWTLSTSDLTVYRCMIDHAFSIVLTNESNLIRIEILNDFALKTNGATQAISVNNTKSVAEALTVLNKPLVSLKMYKAGRLEIQIDTIQIVVEPADEYEAWQISSDEGIKGLRVICMPSGQLAIWLPTSD